MKTQENPLTIFLQSELNCQVAISTSLRGENSSLKEQVVVLTEKTIDLENQVILLTERIEWFKKQIFGQRSEKEQSILDGQLNFFDLLNDSSESKEPPKEDPAPEKKPRKKPKRDGQDAIKFPEDIPKKTTFIDIPEKDKICKETGIALVQIGEEVTQRLAHTAGSYYIKEIIRPKYAHPEKEEFGILTADLPDSILPKCSADESLLAELCHSPARTFCFFD